MDKAKLPQPKPKASGASAASNMAAAASRKSASSAALSCIANQMLKSLGLEDIDPEHVFEIQNKEGAGAFGRVFRAFYKSDPSKLAALKVIPVALEAGQRGEDIENVRKEIQFLRECDHPNVVAFYGAYYKDGALWVAMEYCGGGSVGDVSRHRRFEEHEIAVIMRGALHGLAYLHSKKKIHRDIKGGNILLTSGGQVKIADFGVSAQLRDTMSRRGTFVGTPYWMSPEMIQDSDYDYKSDIWSLGITAIELADQKPPLFDEHPMRVLIQIPRNPSPQLKNPSSWSVEFSQFLQFCLQKDPVERPTALECLEHVFIRGVEHIERVYSSIGRQEQQVAKSLVVSRAPEIPPPHAVVEAGVADKVAVDSTGVAAAHDLTVASNGAARETEGEISDAMKLKPDGEELKEDCGDGDDIAEDISRLDEDDGSESASDSEDDAGDQKLSTVSQNDKTDDRGLHSKADNSRGSEDDDADDGASSDSDWSGTAEEVFNFRQPASSGLMISSDELLQLSVSESVELPSHVKNQTIVPPATAPSGPHSWGTDAPAEHTVSIPALPTGSQPPTEFKLLLPVASSSPLRKSAKNKALGEQFFVPSIPKPHAVKSPPQPKPKQHQHAPPPSSNLS